ncbi:MarR family transcriptional regulator [Microbacterium sp. H1-D42]|uniref:MarR family winged helix-turn-helix transcriptional regulator n=1 Tax=Microbacterium sp. H1-D42 TaxID=2925844 RepID=UPI001F52C42A|nr:MarR family transcriptional regulator [Microbacterium sp. H1-D42]UNK71385.1 MarR family transcriptional regulator [Microbacterium sp. H1-D42]
MTVRAVVPVDSDEAVAEFQGQLHLVFARARTVWKESAARVHGELSPAGYKLLTFIARAGSASAHQLAEAFEMDKSVVSRQVRMLEELGLVQSRPDESDGRLRVLEATPDAVAALAAVRADHSAWLRSALVQLTPEELRAASKVFNALAEA